MTSTATSGSSAPPAPPTSGPRWTATPIAAAEAIGLDLSDHRARRLTKEILATDGADLVLTMTREHLRHVVAMDRSAWPRTFTLKELARRSAAVGPARADDGGFAAWLGRVGADRRAADMLRPDGVDDIADPYGAPRDEHDRMTSTVGLTLCWLAHASLPAP